MQGILYLLIADGGAMKYIERFFTISNSLIANDGNVNKTELLEFLGTKNDSSENASDKKR